MYMPKMFFFYTNEGIKISSEQEIEKREKNFVVFLKNAAGKSFSSPAL